MTTHYGRQLWDSAEQTVSIPDEFPTGDFGGIWTRSKLWFVCNYLEQTVRGLKNKRSRFEGGLVYLDLFCGTGVTTAGKGSSCRYPGSPILAACVPEGFDRLILVDKDPSATTAVTARVRRTPFEGKLCVLTLNANEQPHQVEAEIPPKSLTIAFIDPYSLDIHFETIRRLASGKAMDLMVLFSDRLDLGRNVHKFYYPQEEENKLDRFLGTTDWRTRYEQLGNQSGLKVRSLFAEIYLNRLQSLGYQYTESHTLDGPNGPAFKLIFASKHDLGLKFFRIATQMDFDGSRSLFD